MVTISSVPPITFCGTGATAEAAREEAASHALGPVLQMGLERNKLCKGKPIQYITFWGFITWATCGRPSFVNISIFLSIYHVVFG